MDRIMMKLGAAAVTVFAAVACGGTLEETMPVQGAGTCGIMTRSPKFANDSPGTSKSSFMVKLERSEDVQSLFRHRDVESVEPLFNTSFGDVELKKSLGMDRWFEVTLAEGADFEKVALDAVVMPVVKTVEFNSLASRPSLSDVHPLKNEMAVAPTRATVFPFNDPQTSLQWNYHNTGDKSIFSSALPGGDINVMDVWKTLSTGDSEIVVAVVDEGVKYSHPDLKANMWVNTKELNGTKGVDDDGNGYVDDIYGYNFVDRGAISWGKSGDTGHGCHCAGVISAVNGNGTGICSIAGGSGGKGNGVRIMSCQIFSGKSGGTASQTARAYEYAADNGASIISCSFGFSAGAFESDTEYKNRFPVEAAALEYFERHVNNPVLDGNVAVFSAGNNGLPYAEFPGALSDFICVSAYAPSFLPASYTNYGPGCNIVAPGGQKETNNYKGEVLSCLTSEISGSDYGYMEGTSMACPHVSGIAALALSYAKKLGKKFTLKEFKTLIVTSANDFDTRLNNNPSFIKYQKKMGTGSIDTWLLMMQIEGIPSIVAPVGESSPIDMNSYFGTASKNLTYLGVEISDEGRESLGLEEEPRIKYGQLFLTPTKAGAAKIKVRAIAGGDTVGGETQIGGMEVYHEISVIARNVTSANGGWL